MMSTGGNCSIGKAENYAFWDPNREQIINNNKNNNLKKNDANIYLLPYNL